MQRMSSERERIALADDDPARGELRPGRRADITILDKNTNRVRMTVSRGNIIYDSENPDI